MMEEVKKKKCRDGVLSQPRLCDLEYLSSKAGCGKTYSSLKHVATTLKAKDKWVYVGKGVQLCDESRELVESFNPSLRCLSIYSGSVDISSGTVLDNICSVLEKGDFDVLFMCHKTLLNCLYKGVGYKFDECSVLIDEVLDVFAIESSYIAKKEDDLHKYLQLREDGRYYLHRADSYIKRLKKDDRVSKGYIKFLEILQSGYGCYIRDGGEEFTDYTVIYPADIRGLLLHTKRCIIMGAKIIDTLSWCLWESSGVTFKPYTDVKLARQGYPNESRVTIYYLTHESNRPRGCSRGLLESLYNPLTGASIRREDVRGSMYGKDSYPDYNYVVEEFMIRTRELLGEKFIYTANRWVYEKDLVGDFVGEDAVRVPYGCFGWNSLKEHTKAAGWFSCKPKPCHLAAMVEYGKLVGFDVVSKYIESNHFEPQLQLLGRTAIRDFNQPEVKLDWVVVDKNTADYIVKYHLPEAKVCDSIALRIPDKRVKNGGQNIKEFTAKYALDSKAARYINKVEGKYRIKGIVPEEDLLLKRLDCWRRGERWKEIKD